VHMYEMVPVLTDNLVCLPIIYDTGRVFFSQKKNLSLQEEPEKTRQVCCEDSIRGGKCSGKPVGRGGGGVSWQRVFPAN
jgi:hypothetical protein